MEIVARDVGQHADVTVVVDRAVGFRQRDAQVIESGRLGVLQELVGYWDTGSDFYFGLSDRLPIRRKSKSGSTWVMIAQNPHLYERPEALRDLGNGQKVRVFVLRQWARASARRADIVVAPSAAMVPGIARTTGVQPARIVVAHLPAAAEFYEAKRKPIGKLKRIVIVGDLYQYKAVDAAIRTADAAARRSGTQFEVTIAGELCDGYPAVAAAIDAARSIQVTVTGRLSRADLVKAMETSDLIMMPSRRESFGLPIVEAMAAGLPVLCRKLPVFHELGSDSVCYFERDSLMAEQLQSVMSPAARMRLRESGIARAQNFRRWDIVHILGPRSSMGSDGRGPGTYH